MNRLATWVANGTLAVLCCFLAVATVRQFLAHAATPNSAFLATSAAPVAKPDALRLDPQRIVEASPFSLPGATAVDMNNLPATQLSLRLLGTLVTASLDTSFAAIEETDSRLSHIVKTQDRIKNTATIVSIERKRIVLDNAGQREELVLDEAPAANPSNNALALQARGTARRNAVRSASAASSLSDEIAMRNRSAPTTQAAPSTTSNVVSASSDPAKLLKQARLLPKFEEGNMVGMQINAIEGDSLFARIGLHNGDIVKEFNGSPVTDTKRGLDMLRNFTTAQEFNLVVQGADGSARSIHYEIREEDR